MPQRSFTIRLTLFRCEMIAEVLGQVQYGSNSLSRAFVNETFMRNYQEFNSNRVLFFQRDYLRVQHIIKVLTDSVLFESPFEFDWNVDLVFGENLEEFQQIIAKQSRIRAKFKNQMKTILRQFKVPNVVDRFTPAGTR